MSCWFVCVERRDACVLCLEGGKYAYWTQRENGGRLHYCSQYLVLPCGRITPPCFITSDLATWLASCKKIWGEMRSHSFTGKQWMASSLPSFSTVVPPPQNMVSTSAYVSGQKRPAIDQIMSCQGLNFGCYVLLQPWTHLLLPYNLAKLIDSLSYFDFWKKTFHYIVYVAFFPALFLLTLFCNIIISSSDLQNIMTNSFTILKIKWKVRCIRTYRQGRSDQGFGSHLGVFSRVPGGGWIYSIVSWN